MALPRTRTVGGILLLLALVTLMPVTAPAQQNAIRVEFAGDSARSTVIGAFRSSGGTLYASLTDLAQVLALTTYENREARKLELKHPPLRLKVSGGNPFVIITDQADKQSAYQLDQSVLYAANAFFVPLQSFIPLFHSVFGINVAFDPRTRVLGIGVKKTISPFDIASVQLEPKANGMLIRINAQRKLTDYENWLRSDGWLYVTIGDARADINAINALKPTGIVREVIAIQSPTSVQLTFRLSGKIATSEILPDDASNDLLLLVRTQGTEEAAAKREPETPPRVKAPAAGAQKRSDEAAVKREPETPPVKVPAAGVQKRSEEAVTKREVETPPVKAPSAGVQKQAEEVTPEAAPPKRQPEKHIVPTEPAPSVPPKEQEPPPLKKERDLQPGLDTQRKRWELDVIVLDAGHGGYDPGTIGITGVKEKNVSLGIVLKLGSLLTKNLKGVRVVYTRKDDRFVELDRRGKIANEASGKLFISVHCNALKRKPSATRGFEVYLLRPGRTEEAIAIAERENSVIELEEGYESRYQQLTEENFILVTMAQSAHVKASEMFADLTQQEMASRTGIPNRGVKQAGFYVLVGAAMPNVLVETAYLSNREDERFLKSEAGQQKIAEALFRAVKKYKEEYEKLLMEGKEIGEAR